MMQEHDAPRRARQRQVRDEHPTLAAAREYAARGWCVVPLAAASKVPLYAGWAETRLAADALAAHFPVGGNIGLATGRRSGGLVDVDCDAPEARTAAALLLPHTARIHGRPGAPASHYWYRVDLTPPPPLPRGEGEQGARQALDAGAGEQGAGEQGARQALDAYQSAGTPPASATRFSTGSPSPRGERGSGGEVRPHPIPTAHFAFTEEAARWGLATPPRAMLVELRGDGGQTMAPPSLHPTREALRWEREGEPRLIAEGELRARVAQVAACALLARHWPESGQRDEAALALCGMLMAGGWNAVAADSFTVTVARVAEDEEWERRAKGAATARRRAAGQPVTGRARLAARLRGDGARVTSQVRAWLGLAELGGEDAFAQGATYYPGEGGEGGKGDESADTTDPIFYVDEVAEVDLHWLWEGRLPLGKLTMLDGDPGLGKSLLTLDLVARVVRGLPMPDGSPGLAGGAVILSAEDGMGDTVRPRLRAAGVVDAADLHRIASLHAIPEVDPTTGIAYRRGLSLTRDLPWVAEAARAVGARLLVVDPLMAYLTDKTNTWRDQDVRVALAPLAKLAEELDLAVLVLRHLNKTAGASALYRGGGSIGLIAAARAGWLVAKDPDDPDHGRVLAHTKSNLGPPLPALRYRIETDVTGKPHLIWLGESAYSADALLAAAASAALDGPVAPRKGPGGRLGEATAWLGEALADGPRPRAELVAEAAIAGFTERTLEEARKHVPARWRREGFGATSKTVWELAGGASA